MKFNKIYLSHSLELDKNSIIVDADSKIKAYIKYRMDREKFLLENLKVRNISLTCQKQEKMTKDGLFNLMYGDRDLSDEL